MPFVQSRIFRILPKRRSFASGAVEEEALDAGKFLKYMFLPALGFGAKYMAGDAIAQSMNNEDFNLKRNVQWGAFGLAMSSIFYSPMWIRIYPRYINRYKYGNVGVAGFQTFVFEPFIFMPCFYAASAVFNQEFESNFASNVVSKWKDNFATDFKTLTFYGVPVFGLNATVVPVQYRSWFITGCGVIFSAFIIRMKVDVTTEDILLPRRAIPIITEEFVPIIFDIGSGNQAEVQRLSKREGGMTLEDFTAFCKRSYPTWHEKSVRTVFASMDLDNNGTVDLEEVNAYFEGARLLVENREKLLSWFDGCDDNKDGVVEKVRIELELKKWFRDDYVVAMFEKMDEEGNGVVSREEFIHFLSTQAKAYE